VAAAYAKQIGAITGEVRAIVGEELLSEDSDSDDEVVTFLSPQKTKKLKPEPVLPARNFAWATLKEFSFGEYSIILCVGITNNTSRHYMQLCADGRALGKTKRYGKNITVPIEAVKALLKVLSATKRELLNNPSLLKFTSRESSTEPWDTKLDYNFDWITSTVYYALRVFEKEKENPAVLFLEQTKGDNKISIQIPLVASFNDFFRVVGLANDYRKLNKLA
jgi:hypothetical protein